MYINSPQRPHNQVPFPSQTLISITWAKSWRSAVSIVEWTASHPRWQWYFVSMKPESIESEKLIITKENPTEKHSLVSFDCIGCLCPVFPPNHFQLFRVRIFFTFENLIASCTLHLDSRFCPCSEGCSSSWTLSTTIVCFCRIKGITKTRVGPGPSRCPYSCGNSGNRQY